MHGVPKAPVNIADFFNFPLMSPSEAFRSSLGRLSTKTLRLVTILLLPTLFAALCQSRPTSPQIIGLTLPPLTTTPKVSNLSSTTRQWTRNLRLQEFIITSSGYLRVFYVLWAEGKNMSGEWWLVTDVGSLFEGGFLWLMTNFFSQVHSFINGGWPDAFCFLDFIND